ncbi:hypothetical protein [Kribbella sp. NPDC006257]|uniref:hypothetical protein n=1 Tax=Kribbella sp. NPDC006257 TaxID=3156738 RepID=UPI0033BD71A0
MDPAQLAEVFPIRAKIRFRGVGFRRVDGREYYFKTFHIDNILHALQRFGFPVSPVAQSAAKTMANEALIGTLSSDGPIFGR